MRWWLWAVTICGLGYVAEAGAEGDLLAAGWVAAGLGYLWGRYDPGDG